MTKSLSFMRIPSGETTKGSHLEFLPLNIADNSSLTLRLHCGNFRVLILTSPHWLFLIKCSPEPLLNAKSLHPQNILPEGFGLWEPDTITLCSYACRWPHCTLKPTSCPPARTPPTLGATWERTPDRSIESTCVWDVCFFLVKQSWVLVVPPAPSPPSPRLHEPGQHEPVST